MEAKIKEINAWLNGSKDFESGIDLLRNLLKGGTAKANRLYVELVRYQQKKVGPASEHYQNKLVHLLEDELKRLRPAPRKRSKPSIKHEHTTEIKRLPENASLVEKIQHWFSGAKEYSQGRDLLKEIPGFETAYLQLSFRETYPDRIRLYNFLNKAVEILKDEAATIVK